jgi:hypothetical protein
LNLLDGYFPFLGYFFYITRWRITFVVKMVKNYCLISLKRMLTVYGWNPQSLTTDIHSWICVSVQQTVSILFHFGSLPLFPWPTFCSCLQFLRMSFHESMLSTVVYDTCIFMQFFVSL